MVLRPNNFCASLFPSNFLWKFSASLGSTNKAALHCRFENEVPRLVPKVIIPSIALKDKHKNTNLDHPVRDFIARNAADEKNPIILKPENVMDTIRYAHWVAKSADTQIWRSLRSLFVKVLQQQVLPSKEWNFYAPDSKDIMKASAVDKAHVHFATQLSLVAQCFAEQNQEVFSKEENDAFWLVIEKYVLYAMKGQCCIDATTGGRFLAVFVEAKQGTDRFYHILAHYMRRKEFPMQMLPHIVKDLLIAMNKRRPRDRENVLLWREVRKREVIKWPKKIVRTTRKSNIWKKPALLNMQNIDQGIISSYEGNRLAPEWRSYFKRRKLIPKKIFPKILFIRPMQTDWSASQVAVKTNGSDAEWANEEEE